MSVKNTQEHQNITVGNNLDINHILISQHQKNVARGLDDKSNIATLDANPFTVRPIVTEWQMNELIIVDPRLRVMAGVGPLDIGLKQASNYISQQHLNPGWKWYS